MDEDIKQLLQHFDNQIAEHERALAHLRKMRARWIDYDMPTVQIIERNKKLTREIVRKLIKGFGQPLQTTQIMDILFTDLNAEDKYNYTKHLSVMLQQMKNHKEVIVTRKPGIKGNFYTWNIDKQ